MRHFLIIILLLTLACRVEAEEFSVLGGLAHRTDHHRTTGAWMLDYMQGLNEHFAVSFSYLNQGHYASDHRDLHTVSLWTRTNLFDRRLSLAAGAGGLYYYNTSRNPPPIPSHDQHGWEPIFSASASWYTDSRFILQLRTNYILAHQGFDTLSILAGIGYQLEAPSSRGPRNEALPQVQKTTGNELTLFGGQTMVNLPSEGHSLAAKVEYRRGLWRYVDWTAGFLYEGRNEHIDRYGLTTQLWLAKPFFAERLALGVGIGGYFAIDERRHETGLDDPTVAEILTLTASYRLNPSWLTRISWDRIITSYDHDADVFLVGVGYRY